MDSAGSQMAPRGAVDTRQELEGSRLEGEAVWELWQGRLEGRRLYWCCPVSQLVLVLLVEAACELEPGQPDLEWLSCHVLCGGTEPVLPATTQSSLGCGTGGRKTANPSPAVVSWLFTQVYSVGFISRVGLREMPNPWNLGSGWRKGSSVSCVFWSDSGVWVPSRE